MVSCGDRQNGPRQLASPVFQQPRTAALAAPGSGMRPSALPAARP